MKLLILLMTGSLYATDIVQIDVGTARTFRGVLNMKATDVVDPCNHGTSMAAALEDELVRQKSKPVNAIQFVWSRSNFNTIFTALHAAFKEEPKVLSLSYGGGYPSKYEEAFLFAHYLNDTLILAAAGNDGGGTQYYPANYRNPCVISVGTKINGRRAFYSNDADVWLEQNIKDDIGTSASTARMAGIALQVRRNHPELNCSAAGRLLRMLYGL